MARRAGVSPGTLRRWAEHGLIPGYDGRWTPAAAAHARLVARLRDRGHSLEQIRAATESGPARLRLRRGPLPARRAAATRSTRRPKQSGLEPALIERVVGRGRVQRAATVERPLTEEDVDLLRYVAAVLAAGFPLVAFLQLMRVYGQALAQIADAEVRLFHLYVHEPLMRDGVPGLEMAEEMEGLARELLPLASPIMDHAPPALPAPLRRAGRGRPHGGRPRGTRASTSAACAWRSRSPTWPGYTRLTEEMGEEEAVIAVERFVEAVEATLPDDARVIKTIGDEVMIVGSDPAALTDWAVGFQTLVGHAAARCRGSASTTARRSTATATTTAARSTWPRGSRRGPRAARCSSPGRWSRRPASHLEFEPIGEVRLKGFCESTELFLAGLTDE